MRQVVGGGGSGAVDRPDSWLVSDQTKGSGLMGVTAGSTGASLKANETKQPAIIWQPGIPSFDGLESCLLPADLGQQSILSITICFETWAMAGCIMVVAQFGDIAIATLWPRRPNNAQISNARRKNLIMRIFA